MRWYNLGGKNELNVQYTVLACGNLIQASKFWPLEGGIVGVFEKFDIFKGHQGWELKTPKTATEQRKKKKE